MFKRRSKKYVSNIDKFLSKLRGQVPESKSQQVEREQYEQISQSRDHADPKRQDSSIWEKF